ncbi:MAG: GNAT family N-acetyltransferase [Clostridiales bacterium]|jgi:ribosomal protein S18 acetylase RimI-like enzyme|nr:GNAT family N-acetyltransferase [Clostridiales bacterium]
MSAAERSKAFLSRFDSGQSRFLAMRDGSGIVGAAVFGRSVTEGCPGAGEMSAIYLRKDCIGIGYGHRLFAYAERELAGMGYTDFVLGVFTANKRAIDFYRAHGCTAVDERTVNLGGVDYPYIVLRKRI